MGNWQPLTAAVAAGAFVSVAALSASHDDDDDDGASDDTSDADSLGGYSGSRGAADGPDGPDGPDGGSSGSSSSSIDSSRRRSSRRAYVVPVQPWARGAPLKLETAFVGEPGEVAFRVYEVLDVPFVEVCITENN